MRTCGRTVVADFRKALPSAEIFVYDNNSSDRTVAVARDAGAQVRSERRQGKGHVSSGACSPMSTPTSMYWSTATRRTMPPSAPHMVETLLSGSSRYGGGLSCRSDGGRLSARPPHRQLMLTSFLSMVFGQAFKDILSGYRVLSRRFVKSFRCCRDGFEIETELSVHALELALPVAEIEDALLRPAEDRSSSSTPGATVFGFSAHPQTLIASEKAVALFHRHRDSSTLISVGLAIPSLSTYLEQGLVPRLPTAVLSDGADDPWRCSRCHRGWCPIR